jgi:hypothetical protein
LSDAIPDSASTLLTVASACLQKCSLEQDNCL